MGLGYSLTVNGAAPPTRAASISPQAVGTDLLYDQKTFTYSFLEVSLPAKSTITCIVNPPEWSGAFRDVAANKAPTYEWSFSTTE